MSALEAFTAALLVEQMPVPPVNPIEVRQKLGGDWKAPDSALRLTDRRI